jgi:hypothetical protein
MVAQLRKVKSLMEVLEFNGNSVFKTAVKPSSLHHQMAPPSQPFINYFHGSVEA